MWPVYKTMRSICPDPVAPVSVVPAAMMKDAAEDGNPDNGRADRRRGVNAVSIAIRFCIRAVGAGTRADAGR
jgi:hypothetical protein